MTPSAFVTWIIRNAARVTHYEKGGDGSGDGGCDCIGLIIGAWRMSGNKWPWTHGSNYAARYLTYGLAADQPLHLGDLVYKARSPGEPGYSLPSTYKGHHDKLDYYHVGVVTRTAPLEISHCTSVPGGIKRDTKRGKWKYSGQFNKLDTTTEDTMSYQATVYAKNGKPVKLRAEPSDKCSSYTNIKVGTPAEVIGENGDWACIVAGTRQGYMQRKYLRTADTATQDPSHDTPTEGQEAPQGGLLYQTVQQARAQLEAAQQGLQAAQQAIDTARLLLSDAG